MNLHPCSSFEWIVFHFILQTNVFVCVLVGVHHYICVLVFFFRPYHIPYRHVYNASNFVCVHAPGLLLYARIYIFLLCLSVFFHYSRNLVCAFFYLLRLLGFWYISVHCWFQHHNRSENTHLWTTIRNQSLKRIYAWNKLRWCYFIFKWKCDVRFLSKEIQS